jgi:arginine/lysine/ornithine decarboxylase
MDTRTIEPKAKELKAKVEERRGPAGHWQDDTPILDAIRYFHSQQTLSLAIPAHKSAAGAPSCAKDVLGERAFVADISMLNGLTTVTSPGSP